MKKGITSRIGWLLAAALFTANPGVALASAFRGTEPTDEYYVQCEINSASGAFAQAQSTYTVKGDCEEYDKKNDKQAGTSTFPILVAAFNWTAAGTYQPATHNTTETISLSRPTSTQFTTPVVYTLTAAMLCGQDPWLRPDGLSCGSVRYQAPNTQGLTSYENDIVQSLYATNPVVPKSSLLKAQQRAALIQQYQRQLVSNAPQNKPALVSPRDVTKNPANRNNANRVMQIAAPIITSPKANSNNVEGGFQIKAMVPPGSYTGAEGVYVHFTFLGTATAPSANSFVNIFNISLKDLVNGITVPSYITRSGQGRWLVRAQIASPDAGPWSAAVPFNLTVLSSKNLPSNLNKR